MLKVKNIRKQWFHGNRIILNANKALVSNDNVAQVLQNSTVKYLLMVHFIDHAIIHANNISYCEETGQCYPCASNDVLVKLNYV